VDPLSAPYLNGVTVDFLDSMDGSGFKFENPNAQNSCGCGSSFSA
jgi:iron-sulfur cluster assembly protein